MPKNGINASPLLREHIALLRANFQANLEKAILFEAETRNVDLETFAFDIDNMVFASREVPVDESG